MTPRMRSIVASALLVLTGAAGGVAVDHLVIFRRHAAAMNGSAAGHAAVLLAELDRVLKLTPEQHDAIGAIIVRHQQAIDSAWRLIHHQVDAGMDSVHREVAAVLQPAQMTLLREWMSRQQMNHPDPAP